MALFCDFQVIQGDAVKRLGDGGETVWRKNFETRGEPGGMAVLMFMVAGLTVANSDVRIRVNERDVGKIEHYNGADARHWFSQIVNIGPNILNDGMNEIEIRAVSWSGATEGDLWDDFFIKDVICFFQQST